MKSTKWLLTLYSIISEYYYLVNFVQLEILTKIIYLNLEFHRQLDTTQSELLLWMVMVELQLRHQLGVSPVKGLAELEILL